MTFDINAALSEGWDRTTSSTGLTLIVAFVAVAVATTLVTNSLLRQFFLESNFIEQVMQDAPPGAMDEFRREFENQVGAGVLDIAIGPLLALVVVLWVARILLRIGAIRWFVEVRSGGLSAGLFTRRILWTVLNLIVGGILYAVTVGIGLIFLIAPGIFFAVALFFYNYEIVVEGENAIEALSNSWGLTKGHRLELFLLGLLFAVAGIVLGWLTSPFTIPDPTLQAVVSTTLTAALGVLGIGVAAAAYRQLQAESGESVEALDAEDL